MAHNDLPNGYAVKKSEGRVGYEFKCPKGFIFYNYFTESAAIEDAKEHFKMKREN